MIVYLASSLSNRILNARIASLLKTLGHECFLPQRDTPQTKNGRLTAETNINAIAKVDLVLIVGKNLGNDTSWEAGFARALGKPTVLLYAARDRVKNDYMLFFSVEKVFRLSAYSDLKFKLPSVFRDIAGLTRSNRGGQVGQLP